jgi:hypothetical protein
MLLFRSEEHIDRWCRAWNQPHGAVLALTQTWRLADAWYRADRRPPDWRRKTREEILDLFREIGLTSDFWRL